MPKFNPNPSPFMKGYTYPGTAPIKDVEILRSEQARLDGASDATIQKLKDIEAGKKKRDELTDPTQIARVEAKLKELQPQLKT